MNRVRFFIGLCLVLYTVNLFGQYKWKPRDPFDLNYVDFGDNKLLLYNGIGVGLSALLSKKNEQKTTYEKHHFGIQYFKEYQRSPLSDLISLTYRRRWQFRKCLYVGARARAYHVKDKEVTSQGLGISLTFEWHVIRKPGFRLIYDNGAGPNIFTKPFPFGGTRFNFTTQYGIRSELLISERWYSFGIYNIHISNAGIRGIERNPAFDAIGISMGVLIL